MSITEFLLARITEDEADNNPDVDPEAWCDRQAGIHYTHDRIAAECAAKRAIIEITRSLWVGEPTWGHDTADELLKLTAAVYADHPEYKQEWKI